MSLELLSRGLTNGQRIRLEAKAQRQRAEEVVRSENLSWFADLPNRKDVNFAKAAKYEAELKADLERIAQGMGVAAEAYYLLLSGVAWTDELVEEIEQLPMAKIMLDCKLREIERYVDENFPDEAKMIRQQGKEPGPGRLGKHRSSPGLRRKASSKG